MGEPPVSVEFVSSVQETTICEASEDASTKVKPVTLAGSV